MAVNFIIKGPIVQNREDSSWRTGHSRSAQSTLLRHAKASGIGKKLGRNMIFSEADILDLYQGAPMLKLVRRSGDKVLKKLQAILTKNGPKKGVPSAKPKS